MSAHAPASRRWLMAGTALLVSSGLAFTLVSHHDATAQSTPATGTAAAAAGQSAAAAPAVRGLPDFADLVEQVGPAVVNIRTSTKVASASRGAGPGGGSPDEEMQEFFRRFFGVPIPRPQDPRRAPPQGGDDEGGGAPRGVGSGFIIAADGLVMTNAHVVEGADEVVVRLTDKREFKARVVGADKRTDVALLKIEASGLPTVRFGDVGRLRVGEWVIAIGSPFDLDNTVTAGIVSAKARDTGEMLPFIQTDVAINPGNSGGPLINLRGEVVGINTAIASNSGGNEGIGFSIPINMAMVIVRQLVERGSFERAYMGVHLDQDFSTDRATRLGLPRRIGARVTFVQPGSPAAAAGLRADDVIVSLNGVPVEDDVHLQNIVYLTQVGVEVPAVVIREGKTVPLTVRLQPWSGNQ